MPTLAIVLAEKASDCHFDGHWKPQLRDIFMETDLEPDKIRILFGDTVSRHFKQTGGNRDIRALRHKQHA
jgi:hypothetical protein